MEFSYRGRDSGGNIVKGIIVADTQVTALQELRSRGVFVTYCREEKARQFRGLFTILINKSSRRDLAVFSRQLSTMLQSGLPIVNALKILEKQTGNNYFKKSIKSIYRELESGRSLSKALEQQPETYPAVFTYTVEAGELVGALDETLERLSEHLEREHEIEEKVKSALTYPAVVSVVAVMAVVFLLSYILPVFQSLLNSMEMPLPWSTRMIIGVSEFLRQFWAVLFVIMSLCLYRLLNYRRRPEGRYKLDRVLLCLPVVGPLHHKTVMSRFSRTLGTLLRSGVPVLVALEVVSRNVGNSVVAGAVKRAAENIRNGRNLAESLEAGGVFPPMVVEMINVGEETGKLDLLLAKISSFYDREVSETVSRLSSIIEPFLIITLGGIVAVIVVSILLPMFSMYSGLHF